MSHLYKAVMKEFSDKVTFDQNPGGGAETMLIPAFLISEGTSNTKGGFTPGLFTEGRGGQHGWRGGGRRGEATGQTASPATLRLWAFPLSEKETC